MCNCEQQLETLRLRVTDYMLQVVAANERLVLIGKSSTELEAHLTDQLLDTVKDLSAATNKMITEVLPGHQHG